MRKDQELKDKYQKDDEYEKILSLMNDKLFEAEGELLEDLPENFPTIHILGAPRSGTTLALQLLSEHFDVGYINNLIASFWKAPLFGISLSQKLLSSNYQSSYSSKFGRTDNIQEPHEFGYFWNYHLKYDDFQQRDVDHEKKIEWGYFSSLLKNMCKAFGKPLLFKSFLYGFHAKKAVEELEKTIFIYLRRDLIDNAMSILKMRKKYLGSLDKWASIKPKQYSFLKEQNNYVQVVGQILFLEIEYLKQLKAIPEKNYLILNYNKLCENPGDTVERIKSLVENNFRNIGFTSPTDIEFQTSQYKRNNKEVDKIRKAETYLLNKFPELQALIENRK